MAQNPFLTIGYWPYLGLNLSLIPSLKSRFKLNPHGKVFSQVS
jgi:hypothetical protein